MTISVVMPTLILNEELFTQVRDAINSVENKDIELIIVDNGSVVGEDFLRAAASIYIRYPEKIGFGPACNAGLKLATGDYLAITSIDVKFLIEGFKQLSEEFDKIEDIGVICPSGKNRGDTLDGMFHLGETEGAAFLISREVYDKVKLPEGLYDERYKQGYFEDTDLWYRMDELGLKQFRSGNVYINHLEGTTQKALGTRDKYFNENKIKFEEKWGEESKWLG